MSAYCTTTYLEDRISAAGKTLRIDDYSSSGTVQADLLTRIIENASAQVDLYLLSRYDSVTLAANTWVKHATADLAICILARRRGNPVPDPFAAQCKEVMEQLKLIKDGELPLPEAAERKDSVPVLSNVRVRLDPYPRTVVEQSRSTGVPAGYAQNTDTLDLPPRY